MPYFDGRSAIANEKAESASVGNLRFAARKDEENFSAPVGYKTLDAAQEPIAIFVLISSNAYRLQVGPRVRFGKNHGAGYLAACEFRKVFVFDFVGRKRVDGFGNSLQTKHVHKGTVAARDNFRRHRINERRAVDSAVLAGKGKALKIGQTHLIQVLLNERMKRNRLILIKGVSLSVDRFGIFRQNISGNVADDLENSAVVVDSVVYIARQIVGVAVRRFTLLYRGNVFQIEIIEQELDILIVGVKIGHKILNFLGDICAARIEKETPVLYNNYASSNSPFFMRESNFSV